MSAVIPVNMRRPRVAAGIDQRVPHILGLAVPIDVSHRYLDHPVGLRIKPRCLDVDQGEVMTKVNNGRGPAGSEQ